MVAYKYKKVQLRCGVENRKPRVILVLVDPDVVQTAHERGDESVPVYDPDERPIVTSQPFGRFKTSEVAKALGLSS